MSSPATPVPIETRMSAAERREQILDAATDLFGRRGYHATTTDQVAQAAGISQPYVVRMFGTKEKLFLEVLDRALTTLLDAFRSVLAETPDDEHDERDEHDEDNQHDAPPLQARLGAAFVDLVQSRGVHRTLLHGFVSGNDPVIGAAARKGFVDIYRFLRDEAGFSPVEINGFLAQGMLFSVLLGIELPSTFGQDADSDELMVTAFADKCDIVLATAGPHVS